MGRGHGRPALFRLLTGIRVVHTCDTRAMKVFIILSLAAVGSAVIVENSVAESGVSTQHRTQDVLGNYNFGYDEKHTSGGSWRKESGDVHGNTVGSYGLTDADGRVRVVHYVADSHGFRASVATNEPGTLPSSPSGVGINAPMGPTGPHGEVSLAGIRFVPAADAVVPAGPDESRAAASSAAVAVPGPVTSAAAPTTRVAVAAPRVIYSKPSAISSSPEVTRVARVAMAAPRVMYSAHQVARAAAPKMAYAAAPMTRVAYASAPFGRVNRGGSFRATSVNRKAAASVPVLHSAAATKAVKFANFRPARVVMHAAGTPVATYAMAASSHGRAIPITVFDGRQSYVGGHEKYRS